MAVYKAQPTAAPQLDRIMRLALIVGGVALLAGVLGAFLTTTTQFFQSYLYAFLFWMNLSLGSLGLLLLQYLVGGRWGMAIKRLLEAGAANVALTAVLFLPLLLGLGALYPWARPDEVASNEILAGRTPWLNLPLFLLRAVIYFVVWGGLAYLLRRWSLEQDRTGNFDINRRLRMLSGIGLVFFVLTLTFATFDWGMATEPVWFSTIYGVIYLVMAGLSTFSLMAIAMSMLRSNKQFGEIASPGRFHDIGTLMFAFTVLWAYTNFSQFLIIFAANLVEEASYYVVRSQGGWEILAYLMMAAQFGLPFFLLLSRRTKRSPQRLPIVAAIVLVMQAISLFWVLVPTFHPEQLTVSWLDIVLLIGLGGLWIAAFAFWLKRRPLVAVNDPRIVQMYDHGHGSHEETASAAHA